MEGPQNDQVVLIDRTGGSDVAALFRTKKHFDLSSCLPFMLISYVNTESISFLFSLRLVLIYSFNPLFHLILLH